MHICLCLSLIFASVSLSAHSTVAICLCTSGLSPTSRLSVHVWLSPSICSAHLARRRCCVSHCTSGSRHLSVHILPWHLGAHLRAHLAVPMSGRPPPFVSVSVRLCHCLSLICSSASVSASVIRLACFLAVWAISMASLEASESASWPSWASRLLSLLLGRLGHRYGQPRSL